MKKIFLKTLFVALLLTVGVNTSVQAQLRIGLNGVEFGPKEQSEERLKQPVQFSSVVMVQTKPKRALGIGRSSLSTIPMVEVGWNVLSNVGYGAPYEGQGDFLDINNSCLENIVTKNKTLSEDDKRNLVISLIVLKYTQSNSVCYVKDGQAIGIGAGQQSRVHCTRLAGQKADNWWLRQCPKVLELDFVDGIKRADRDNAIDVYIGDEYMDVLAEGKWQNIFKTKPSVFTKEEKLAWIEKNTNVAIGSDAFFPFGDNIERAKKSGVTVIAQPGGSVRDDNVIAACDSYNMVMAFTGIRLFHH